MFRMSDLHRMCTWCARGRGSRSAARCRSSQLYPEKVITIIIIIINIIIIICNTSNTRFRFARNTNLLALLLALVQEVVVNLRGDCLGTQGIIIIIIIIIIITWGPRGSSCWTSASGSSYPWGSCTGPALYSSSSETSWELSRSVNGCLESKKRFQSWWQYNNWFYNNRGCKWYSTLLNQLCISDTDQK